MKKILLILIPITLAVVIGIAALIVSKNFASRPNNPIKNLRQTVENHDAENFYKFVDVDKILDSAAEGILTAQINSKVDALAYSTQDYINKYESLKPDFITSAKNYLDQYLATGKIIFQEPLTDAQKFLKNSRVDTCEIKTFTKPKTVDGETHATVEFYNAGMNFYFELDLTLEKVRGTGWRIVNAKGFENYFSGYSRALRKKLEDLNIPVRDQIKEIVNLKGMGAEVSEGDEYGFSKTLKLTFKAEMNFDKPIDSIAGRIIISGKDDTEGVTPFWVDMAGRKPGVQTFDVEKILNPFVREDAEVMKHGLRRNNLRIEITQINFADGTTLKEAEELP